MKKILSIMIMVIFSVSSYAQKDVTKFLGISVDGSKSAMIQKLKGKGFTSDPLDKGILSGQFNGANVNIFIVTNNNKVCRIMVCDANTMNETDIRIRFNNLCEQFQNNKRYMPASSDDYTLSDDEDISYGMSVDKKRYEAVYYQWPTAMDSTAISNDLKSFLFSKYTKEQISDTTEEQQKEIMMAVSSYIHEKYSKRSV